MATEVVVTPLIPVPARFDGFVYTKKKIAPYKKTIGFRVWAVQISYYMRIVFAEL